MCYFIHMYLDLDLEAQKKILPWTLAKNSKTGLIQATVVWEKDLRVKLSTSPNSTKTTGDV